MDKLNCHKVEVVEKLTTEVRTKVLNLTTYSTDFNPIEMLWSVFKYLMYRWSDLNFKKCWSI